jgi:hypothetical protein
MPVPAHPTTDIEFVICDLTCGYGHTSARRVLAARLRAAAPPPGARTQRCASSMLAAHLPDTALTQRCLHAHLLCSALRRVAPRRPVRVCAAAADAPSEAEEKVRVCACACRAALPARCCACVHGSAQPFLTHSRVLASLRPPQAVAARVKTSLEGTSLFLVGMMGRRARAWRRSDALALRFRSTNPGLARRLTRAAALRSGKSTVGRLIAQRLGYTHLDTCAPAAPPCAAPAHSVTRCRTFRLTPQLSLARSRFLRALRSDALVQGASGMSVAEIFASEGEESFRDVEAAVLNEVSSYGRVVVSTGGGVVMRRTNWGHLRNGLIVYLDAPAECAPRPRGALRVLLGCVRVCSACVLTCLRADVLFRLLATRVAADGVTARPLLAGAPAGGEVAHAQARMCTRRLSHKAPHSLLKS